jgi:hypothetical protein
MLLCLVTTRRRPNPLRLGLVYTFFINLPPRKATGSGDLSPSPLKGEQGGFPLVPEYRQRKSFIFLKICLRWAGLTLKTPSNTENRDDIERKSFHYCVLLLVPADSPQPAQRCATDGEK